MYLVNRCDVIPVYEGYALPHATLKLEVGGRDIDQHIHNTLVQQHPTLQLQHARRIKEEYGYVAMDLQNEPENPQCGATSFTLPDGAVVSIGDERFKCPELFFRPDLIDSEAKAGLHELTWQSMMKCDVDIRVKNLSANILITGGSSMFPGKKYGVLGFLN